MVGESLPLFVAKGHFTTEIAELRLSRLVYLFPMALAAFVGWARQREDRASLWLLAGWALGLGLVTLLQRRFMNCFSVALALVTGWAAVALFRAAGRLSGRAARTAAALALACVLLFLLAPVRRAYDPLLRNAARALRGQSPIPDRSRSQKLGPLQVAEWMREATPETSGFLDASRRPEYGVLAPWGDGHVLQYVGRRPTVVDNFGDDLGPENFLASRRYFGLASEEEAAALLEELRVRYVVVRPSAALSGPMFHRLYAEDGAGLGRHRMVYETPFAERTAHLPSIKVFELVAGARVVGRAPPGERVRATLSLWTPRRRTAFASETLADEDGRYALRLPYATRGAPPSCRPDEAYVVEAAGRSHPLVVDERAVRQGLELPGPDLRR
jgi:asparagine N-glycosylation enzyme membrane subunit Stt3